MDAAARWIEFPGGPVDLLCWAEEPSGVSTRLPVPTGMECEQTDGTSETYTALYAGRVIAFQFEITPPVVSVEVLTELPEAEKDYLESWLLSWCEDELTALAERCAT